MTETITNQNRAKYRVGLNTMTGTVHIAKVVKDAKQESYGLQVCGYGRSQRTYTVSNDVIDQCEVTCKKCAAHSISDYANR